jgi:hypothetical protein
LDGACRQSKIKQCKIKIRADFLYGFKIVRYRHRGTKIPTPWTIDPASHAE